MGYVSMPRLESECAKNLGTYLKSVLRPTLATTHQLVCSIATQEDFAWIVSEGGRLSDVLDLMWMVSVGKKRCWIEQLELARLLVSV